MSPLVCGEASTLQCAIHAELAIKNIRLTTVLNGFIFCQPSGGRFHLKSASAIKQATHFALLPQRHGMDTPPSPDSFKNDPN
jgi:hypothetical protein